MSDGSPLSAPDPLARMNVMHLATVESCMSRQKVATMADDSPSTNEKTGWDTLPVELKTAVLFEYTSQVETIDHHLHNEIMADSLDKIILVGNREMISIAFDEYYKRNAFHFTIFRQAGQRNPSIMALLPPTHYRQWITRMTFGEVSRARGPDQDDTWCVQLYVPGAQNLQHPSLHGILRYLRPATSLQGAQFRPSLCFMGWFSHLTYPCVCLDMDADEQLCEEMCTGCEDYVAFMLGARGWTSIAMCRCTCTVGLKASIQAAIRFE